MRRLFIALARRCRGEAGFTLIELLVTVIMLVVILGAASTVLVGVQRQSPNDVERARMIGQGEAGLARMDRELRGGYAPSGTPLPTTSGNTMDVLVGSQRVRYDCTVSSTAYPGYKQCVRYASTTLTSPPSSNGLIVIDGVSNDEVSTDSGYTPVFTPNSSTTPTYYTVEIQVPAKGQRTGTIGTYTYNVTLTDGLYMRNTGVTNRALGGQ